MPSFLKRQQTWTSSSDVKQVATFSFIPCVLKGSQSPNIQRHFSSAEIIKSKLLGRRDTIIKSDIHKRKSVKEEYGFESTSYLSTKMFPKCNTAHKKTCNHLSPKDGIVGSKSFKSQLFFHKVSNKKPKGEGSVKNLPKILPNNKLTKKNSSPRRVLISRISNKDKSESLTLSPVKHKKIFYSEKQSQIVDGIPSVPPSTPCLVLDGAVASFSDLKSQQKIIKQLKKIEIYQLKKTEKLAKKELANEIKKQSEALEMRKAYQRNQIYAMNKLMAEYERQQFEDFKAKQIGAPV